MTRFLKFIRRIQNQRRIKFIRARQEVLRQDQARYQALGLVPIAAAFGALITEADDLIKSLQEAA